MLDTKLEKALEEAARAIDKLRCAIKDNGARRADATASKKRAPRGSKKVSLPANTAYVYVAGSRGLKTLTTRSGAAIMRSLKLTGTPYISKIGTTTLDIETRLRQLGADRIGAYVRDAKGDIVEEDGFARWIAQMISVAKKSDHAAIKVAPRYIAVALPDGMTARAFDGALSHALSDRALHRVPPGVVPPRWNRFDLVTPRINASRELYAFCPHDAEDGNVLLRAIENVLGAHERKRASR